MKVSKSNKEKRGSDCTYLSLSFSEQDEASGNKQSLNEESISQESYHQYPREFELDFISISKKYELLMVSKLSHPFRKNQGNQIQSEAHQFIYTCFCGKELKLKRNFISHVENSHRFSIESLSFLKAAKMLKMYELESEFFKLDTRAYLKATQKAPFNKLTLPQQMIFLPQQFKDRLKINLKDLLKLEIAPQNYFFQSYRSILHREKQYFFSQQFMECIRSIIIKHVSCFERRFDMHLKNMPAKNALFLFIFNLSTLLRDLKESIFGKRTKNKPIFSFSYLIECICWNLTEWIDQNYLKVLEKHQIYSSHIELNEEEKYTESQRLWKFQLFICEYLRFTETKYLGQHLTKIVKFILKNVSYFVQLVVSEDKTLFFGTNELRE